MNVPVLALLLLPLAPAIAEARPAEPQPPAPAAASPAEPACDLHAPRRTDWTLPPPSPFYGQLASRAQKPFAALVGRLADDYSASEFTLPEFSGVLASLEKLVRAKDARAASLLPLPGEPRCGGGSRSDSLVLYIDPTCDACAHVVDLAASLAKACPSSFPSLVFRLAPAHQEEIALDTAVFLESVALRAPEVYCDAVVDVLKAPPGNASELATLEKQYAKLLGGRPLDAGTARSRIAARQKTFPASELGAPSVFYRGRQIRSTGAFDPFRTRETLLHATAFIRLFDGPGAR
jgi:hypothetical protein